MAFTIFSLQDGYFPSPKGTLTTSGFAVPGASAKCFCPRQHLHERTQTPLLQTNPLSSVHNLPRERTRVFRFAGLVNGGNCRFLDSAANRVCADCLAFTSAPGTNACSRHSMYQKLNSRSDFPSFRLVDEAIATNESTSHIQTMNSSRSIYAAQDHKPVTQTCFQQQNLSSDSGCDSKNVTNMSKSQ